MRRYEGGNAIVIILIALAVCAVLAFAMLQPSRISEKDADVSMMVNSALVTHYPKEVRKAVMRLITKGVGLEKQEFNTNDAIVDPKRSVFHDQGGQVAYAFAPSVVMANGEQGVWNFNMNFEVENLGQSGAGVNGNEMIAFLPGVTQTICEQVNTDNNIPSIPTTPNYADAYNENQTDKTMMNGFQNVRLKSASGDELNEKLFGCFQNGGLNGEYVVYYVLAQR